MGEQPIMQGDRRCCLNTSPAVDYSGPACWYCGQFRRSVLTSPSTSALKKQDNEKSINENTNLMQQS